MIKRPYIAKYIYSALVLAGVAFALQSCRSDNPNDTGYEYMPDMYRSPSLETYSQTGLFADSMTARKPVYGTIPRSFGYGRDSMYYVPYPYPNTNEGYEAAGTELKNPMAKTEANVAAGKAIFDVYCIHCHGAEGKGDGSIVANGKYPPPPSYSNQLKDLPEGKIYHSITYGKNMMGPHASLVNQADRWKLVLYVQSLQKLGSGSGATENSKNDSTALAKK